MDLALSAGQRRTVEEAGAWLLELLPSDYAARAAEYRADLEFRSRYQRAAYDAGWLAPGAVAELGGRGLDPVTELLVKMELARRNAPKLPNVQGPGVVAPALLEFGTPAQREHAVPVLRGDEWWCLGMSEPGAGSDLAGLRTVARRDGGGFVVEGQKTWTSHAAASSWCLVFARTDMDGAPHRTITAFVVSMADPRVSVHPIAKLGSDDEEFCDVFFDGVTVGADSVLGPIGAGWQVAMESLAHERDMIWIMNLVEIERCVAIGRERAGAALADRLEQCAADADALWLMGLRSVSARAEGLPDRVGPMLKLFSSEALGRAVDLASDAVGPESVLIGPDAPLGGYLAMTDIEGMAARLYGGTSEIQRNIVGERVLGLPRDGSKLS